MELYLEHLLFFTQVQFFNNSEIVVGTAFKKDKATSYLINIFEDRINRQEINSWEFIKTIIQTIFILNFDKSILDNLKYTNIVLLIEKTISRAMYEGNQNRLILECLKVWSFYSQDDTLWSQMITRSFIKALFMMLSLKDKEEKRYPLSILNDILPSPIALKFIKELPFKEGMNKLYTLYPKDQVEVILKRIVEEHKNLQGFPLPTDFLNNDINEKELVDVSIDKNKIRRHMIEALSKY